MTLPELIIELRRELADAKWFRFHSRVVPSSTEAIQISRWDSETEKWQPNWDEMLEVLDAGFGMSLSRPAEMFLEGKGADTLPQRSLEEIGWFCHARHSAHCEVDGCPPEGLPARTPVCERIARRVVEFQQPLAHIADRLERPVPEIHDLAFKGLRHARAWRHRQLHAYMRSARENERDTRVQCPLCSGATVTMRPPRKAA